MSISDVVSAVFGGDKPDTVGNMSREQFEEKNEDGAAAVGAVETTDDQFSIGDQQLFLQVAAGGTMQLEVSKVAVDNATDAEVKEMAQAEVDEQSGLSDKLQEIADAKGITLPSEPDADTKAMVQMLKNLSGAEFDRTYIEQSGINGHEKLDAVMSRVESAAENADLKELAAAAHPLVLTHLQVSRAIAEKMAA